MTLPHLPALLHDVTRAAAPGAAIVVSVDGERLSAAAGVASLSSGAPLTPESRFQLGCITKLLTAVIVLELVSEDRLDANAPIGRYLPELDGTDTGGQVRVEHLLSHTGGYRGVNVADPTVRHYYNWDKLLHQLRSKTSLFAPGTVFSYEHTECVLLGAIAARVTGEHIHDLYRDRVFAPLGIRCGNARNDVAEPDVWVADHSFEASTNRHIPLKPGPHCSFWDASLSDLTMSLSDLVQMGEAVAGFRAPSIFHPETIQRLRASRVRLPPTLGGRYREQLPDAFGFGCGHYGDSVFGHNGSARGQTCALRFDLSSRSVLVAGMNSWRPHVRDLLCRKVIRALSAASPSTAREPRVDWNFADLIGNYVGAEGTSAEVTRSDDDHLICAVGGAPAHMKARVVISRGADGGISAHSESEHLSVGFFLEPVSNNRGMMIGLNAFRRAESRTCAVA